jgi:hypothetical protein
VIALLVRSAALLLLAFALVIGVIRAQPYHDNAIRAFFTPPEGCAPPCWQGIRPGITTLEEARAVLEHYGILQGPPTVQRWEWNETAPPFVRSSVGRLVLWDRIVYQVDLPDVIGLSDVLITFGRPAWGRMRYDLMDTRRALYYELYYPELDYRPLIVDGDCTTPLMQLTVSYSVREGNPPIHGDTFDLLHWLYMYCS